MEGSSRSGFAIGMVTGLGIGICLGFLFRGRLVKKLVKGVHLKGAFEEASFDEFNATGECKLVLVVRNDLKMGKGKAAAQCSHASVIAYGQVAKRDPNLLKLWQMSGQRKVVLKVEDEAGLLKLKTDAVKSGLITSMVHDAGHTQVAAGSLTVLGVGPAPERILDTVTGHLKLY